MKLYVKIVLVACVCSALAIADDSVRDSAADESKAMRALPLVDRDVVVFVGGTNLVRALKAGYLEAMLTSQFAKAKPRFRDMAWEADTVFQQGTVVQRWRKEAFGDWKTQLKEINATVIIAQYGQSEALEGPARLPAFGVAYGKLLDEFSLQTKRIVLVSPTPLETSSPLLPDLAARNADLEQYVEAIRDLAANRGHMFVDLFHPLQAQQSELNRFTDNGMHVSPSRQAEVAKLLSRQLGVHSNHLAPVEPLRQAVIKKHGLWFDYWRPTNWKCLFGDDGERRFGRASGSSLSFRDEWKTLPQLIRNAEQRVYEHSLLTYREN